MAFNPISSNNSPPISFEALTPSDSVLIVGKQWLRVGVAGNVVIQGPSDAASVTVPASDGEYIPFGSGYVMAATTATGILALG